jgi:DNA-binding SARP family transcriptional activator/tetratricopeptide (TPR) repeat protein
VFFGYLGPLLVEADRPVELTAPSLRTVLAMLLTHAGQPVATDELADVVWDAKPPRGATDSLRTYVMRLRRVLGPAAAARIVTHHPGYLVEAAEDEVDALRFARHYRDGVAAVGARDWAAARELFAEGLALWRGRPLADVPSQLLRDAEIPALDQMRLQALHWRIDADLRLGSGDELVPELRALIAVEPLREHFHVQLMTALAQAGRQAEALAAYQHAREMLVEQLGIEPGAELRELQQRLLSGETRSAPGPNGAARLAPVPRAGRVPRQLPAADQHFTGRLAELKTLDGLLGGTAAISGTAGAGKTALALHWAHKVADRFPDGQLYVNLRGFDPDGRPVSTQDALRGFLDALREPGEPLSPDPDAHAALYRSLTAGRRLLIMLDNARDEEQVRPLLPGSAECLTLITSRSQLTGLVATSGAIPVEVGMLTGTEADELLCRRLGASRVAAAPTAARQLVTACSGLPLALCIAAARAAVSPGIPLADLADQISAAGLDALSGSDPRADLRKVFSWSYRQLSEDAARLFRLCPAFGDLDLTVPAAASMLPDGLAADLIAELTRVHLLDEYLPGRFRMHDLLAAYARERAEREDTAGEREQAVRRLLEWYTSAAATAATLLAPHHQWMADIEPAPGIAVNYAQAMGWFEAEGHNLIAAVSLAAAHHADGVAARLPRTLWPFLDLQARWQEWVDTHRTGIEAAQRMPDPDCEAYLWSGLAHANLCLGRAEDSIDCLHRAQAIRKARRDRAAEAIILGNLSNVYLHLGRGQDAITTCEQAIALSREVGNRANEARGLNSLGWMYQEHGRPDEAVRCHLAAAADAAELSDPATYGSSRANLAHAYLRLGRISEAIATATGAVELNGRLGARVEHAHASQVLGDALDATGDRARAREHWLIALAAYEELHDTAAVAALREKCGAGARQR